MKNEFLQNVIADAEVIKKMAIENAKASLNETFDSKLKSMLSAKLQEEADDMEDDEEKNEEFEFEAKKSKKAVEEPEKDESEDEESEEESDEEESTDESLDIDAILAEMEEEDDEEKVDEYKERGTQKVKGGQTHSDYSDYYEKNPKDTQEMSEGEDEEVNEYKEKDTPKTKGSKVNLDYSDYGDVNPEDAEEVSEGEDEDEMDEEMDLEALLAEMEELDEKKASDEDEDQEAMDEENEEDIEEADAKKFVSQLGKLGKEQMKKLKKFYDDELSPKSVGPGGKYEKSGYSSLPGHKSALQELNEAKKEMAKLVSKINETNLINAKLLYFNKIMKNVDLNESQKVKVMSAFDKVKTPQEAKLVYEALNDTLASKKAAKTTTIKESYGIKGIASKPAGVSTSKQTILNESESDANVKRWQKLAGLIK